MCFKKPSQAAVAPIQQAAAAIPAKAPAPAPPVTERSVEVDAASRQAKVDAKKRKGLRATLLAGETGGAMSTTTETKGKTLLG